MNKIMTDSIKFKAEKIRYENGESGFMIVSGTAYMDDSKYPEKCSIKGVLFGVDIDDNIYAMGYWETHPKYGKTFKVESFIKEFPQTRSEIMTYLGNGNIAGIGAKKAKMIVDKFGEDSLNVLYRTPELLSEIPGFGKKTIKKIAESAKEKIGNNAVIQTILRYIQGFSISPAYAKRIFDCYGANSINVIKENPYRLAEDVKGIGFLKADEIALKNGISLDSPDRVDSAVVYVLKQRSEDGDVYGERESVVSECCGLLGIGLDLINESVDRLVKKKKLIEDNGDLYIPKLFFAEIISAKKLATLTESRRWSFAPSKFEIDNADPLIEYEKAQSEAILEACQSSVVVITGGPGTGKTTVTKGIIHLFKSKGMKVLCVAPTGKAAKRMTEATGVTASTIHKVLELRYDRDSKKHYFARNEEKPLSGDAIIIDESSMVDIEIFCALMKAIPVGMKIVIVGDIDQLPSVGCGNVLSDIINSGIIPVKRLTVTKRQAENSDIVKNAHIINSGHTPPLVNRRDGDFFFVDVDGMKPEEVRDKIVHYVCTGLPRCYDVEPDEIQVLAPMKKGHTGVYELNSYIQNKVNPYSSEKNTINYNGSIYREGDKVMCMVNNYDAEVFNGDIGKIRHIKQNKNFYVQFDDRTVEFEMDRIGDFTLAYATTIHKSQGSEYDIVVMTLTNQNYVMLQRNLLYTGLTRAKKVFVLVGQKNAVIRAVHNLKMTERKTHLDERLKREKKWLKKVV